MFQYSENRSEFVSEKHEFTFVFYKKKIDLECTPRVRIRIDSSQ